MNLRERNSLDKVLSTETTKEENPVAKLQAFLKENRLNLISASSNIEVWKEGERIYKAFSMNLGI